MKTLITALTIALASSTASAQSVDYFKVAAGAILANHYCGPSFDEATIVNWINLGLKQRNDPKLEILDLMLQIAASKLTTRAEVNKFCSKALGEPA